MVIHEIELCVGLRGQVFSRDPSLHFCTVQYNVFCDFLKCFAINTMFFLLQYILFVWSHS